MTPSPDELRQRMVDTVRAKYGVTDERVLTAMRTVPRHVFLHDVEDLDAVHHVDRAVPVPGFDPDRLTTSVSAPGLVALMLQWLELAPDLAVLEIGAGRGYNAALLAELGCEVTTIDIDPTLVGPTRERLAALGYDRIVVVEGDGDAGVPDRAPFDRIVATVGCNDVSPAWFDQLAPDGFMVVPVRRDGTHPCIRVTRDGRTTFLGPSGFVSIRGAQAARGDAHTSP